MVDELLSISQNAALDLSTFRKVLKTRNPYSQIISRKKDGDGMNASFPRKSLDERTAEGNSQPVLYKEDIVEILRVQVFLGSSEGFTLCCDHIGRENACYPVSSK